MSNGRSKWRSGKLKSLDLAVALMFLAMVLMWMRREFGPSPRQGAPPLLVTRAGNADITTIAFTPDSREILCGSSDGILTLWSIAFRKQIAAMMVSHPVTAIAADEHHERFVVGCQNGTLYLVDRKLSKLKYDLQLLDETRKDRADVSRLRYFAEQASGDRLTPPSLDEFAYSTNLVNGMYGRALPQLVPARSLNIESVMFAKREFIVAATRDGLFHLVHLPSQRSVPAFGRPYFINNPHSPYTSLPPEQLRHGKSLLMCHGMTAIEYKVNDFACALVRWNITSREAETLFEETLDAPRDGRNLVAASGDGRTIVVVSEGELLLLNDPNSEEVIELGYPPVALALSSDGQHLVSAGISRDDIANPRSTLTLQDVATARVLLKWTGLPYFIGEVSMSPDSSVIAAICSDKAVRVWASTIVPKTQFSRELHRVNLSKEVLSKGEILRVRSVPDVEDDENVVLQCRVNGDDNWTVLSGMESQLPSNLEPGHNTVSFRLFGRQWQTSDVVSADVSIREDGWLKWAATDDPGRMELGIIGAAFDPTGQTVYSLDRKAVFRQRNVETGEIIDKKQLNHDGVSHSAFNPNGTRLALVSRRLDAFKLFQLDEQVAHIPIQYHAREFYRFIVDDRGSRVAATDIYDSEIVQVWRCNPDVTEAETAFKAGPPIAFSASGEFLVCDGFNRVTVRSASDGSVVASIATPGKQKTATSAKLDVVVAAYEDRIESYSLPTLVPLSAVSKIEKMSAVSAMAVSGDGRRVAVGTDAGAITLIEVQERKIFRIDAHRKAINVMAFDILGNRLLSASSTEGNCKMWDANAIEANLGE